MVTLDSVFGQQRCRSVDVGSDLIDQIRCTIDQDRRFDATATLLRPPPGMGLQTDPSAHPEKGTTLRF